MLVYTFHAANIRPTELQTSIDLRCFYYILLLITNVKTFFKKVGR